MIEPNRGDAISRLNKHPLNQSAEKLLPLDWHTPDTLYVLTLALWGTMERGLFPGLDPQVIRLSKADPERAMTWVTENWDGDQVMAPNALDGLGAEHAASLVLESIHDRMES